jgi:multidrug efflux pump subunit AcrB
VIGLLVFNQPFGFMALLGALSLSGMLIKNGIVLVDEINSQLAAGRPAWDAVVDASVSRVRPVSMAVLTTVFGLIPLLFDVFFGAMAVTIVVGLLFASLTPLVVLSSTSPSSGAPPKRLNLRHAWAWQEVQKFALDSQCNRFIPRRR